LLENSGSSAFDILDYFAYRILGRNRDKNVNMIRGKIAADDLDIELFADLADNISGSGTDCVFEDSFTIFGNPD